MQFGNSVCPRSKSRCMILFFFFFLFLMITDVWVNLPLGLSVWVFSLLGVCLQCYLCVCVCVLWEKDSVGCSFISGASSCMKCSSEGTVCPAAGAEWALATQTCGLNTHEHTHTREHKYIYTCSIKGIGPDSGHERVPRTDAKGCFWKVELGHTQAMTFIWIGAPGSNNWQLNKKHIFYSFYFLLARCHLMTTLHQRHSLQQSL